VQAVYLAGSHGECTGITEDLLAFHAAVNHLVRALEAALGHGRAQSPPEQNRVNPGRTQNVQHIVLLVLQSVARCIIQVQVLGIEQLLQAEDGA
jgi:hypothetical protein